MQRPAQAMVEFALAISVFMLLVLGTFDLARGYLAYTVVSNVVREVGRYRAAHPDPVNTTDAEQAGKNLAVGIDSSQLTLIESASTADGLQYVTVTGTYPFQSLTPWVSVLLNFPSGAPLLISVTTSTLVG
jgi:Flp pilus assembly protein TadG